MNWLRLILAWGITFGLLAYEWGRLSIFAMLGGGVDVRLAIVVAMLVGYVVTLSWGVKPPGKAWGMLAVWALVNAGLVIAYAAPRMPMALLVPLFVLSSIWIVWVAWLGTWPLSWGSRLRWLGVWLVFAVLGPMLVRVEGMTGDIGIVFGWRFRGVEPAVPAAVASTTIEVTPTADDFPGFLGPKRTGVVASPPIGTLVERWRRPVGEGWSSVAIVGGYAFTQEQRGESECVTCYRVGDGEPQWTHADTARFNGIGGVGPSATPSFAGGRIYTVGGTGLVNCLDASTGKRVWQFDLLREFAAKNPDHGTCASPLIDGDRVIVCATGDKGPTLVALDRQTGAKLWQSGERAISYSSPMLAEVNGVSQILMFGAEGVGGYARDDGRELWHHEWHPTERINASQPIVGLGGPDRVLVATGYGRGATMLRVGYTGGQWTTETLWESLSMKAKFTTPVMYGGFVYGLDDGVLACVDPATGKRKWKDGRYGYGQILLAGDTLIVQAEKGELVLVSPSPEGLRETGRVTALGEKTWNNPTLAGKYLIVRNDREMACFENVGPATR